MIHEILSNALLVVSNTLLIPDMVLLLAFTALTIAYFGGFVAEAVNRRRHGAAFRAFLAALKRDPSRRIKITDIPRHHGWPARLALEVAPGNVEKWVDDIQLAMQANLSQLHFGIRLGPILGLAGTLIPLGPALAALAGGNTPEFARNLVVSFTTTVVGLFVGSLCYVMHTVRQRWYTQDLNDIEFITKRLE